MADPGERGTSGLPAATSGAGSGTGQAPEITPELVRQVADRVLVLLRADLQVENERRRAAPLASSLARRKTFG